MESARSQEIELSKRYPLDIRGLRRLALMDMILANHRLRDGEKDGARLLIEESVDYWEACLALAPGDLEIQRRLLAAIRIMLPILGDQKNDRLYERWNARVPILKGTKETAAGWGQKEDSPVPCCEEAS